MRTQATEHLQRLGLGQQRVFHRQTQEQRPTSHLGLRLLASISQRTALHCPVALLSAVLRCPHRGNQDWRPSSLSPGSTGTWR